MMTVKSTNTTTITLPTDIPILAADAVAEDPREDCDKNNDDQERNGKINAGGGGGGDAVVKKLIVKSVLRQKLQKLRHLVLPNVINPEYLDALFPQLLEKFEPQIVRYNGGVANIQQWKISCYLEVMDGGVPTADPNVQLLQLFLPLLNKCNDLFMEWYKQQHSCNSNVKGKGGLSSFWERRARQKQQQQQQQQQKDKQLSPSTEVGVDADTATEGKENVNGSSSRSSSRISSTLEDTMSKSRSVTSDKSNKTSPSEPSSASSSSMSCRRLMTFITRYTAAPGEQSLLKHVDGAGKVDGSVVVALPVDRWSAPYDVNSFEGHGGGLTFWDGKESIPPTTAATTETVSDPLSDDGNGQRSTVATAMASTTSTAPATTTSTRPREIHYDTRSGDIAFIDKAVWHQADPITKGTRWALVIFYKVE